jgi:arylsulfatase A-like enzyme
MKNYPSIQFGIEMAFLSLQSKNPFELFPSDFTKGKSDEGPRGDLVLVVDWSLGEINKSLEKYDLKENTLLIFTSDNGPRRGGNGHKSAWKFKGYKANIWEGGHRVPFIARWPGEIKEGTMSNETISLTDMLASFASLSGQTLGTNAGEDSYNILPVLLGEENDNNEQVRIFHSVSGVFALRKGKWKLIEGTKGNGSGNINLNQDSLNFVGQLYNLENDPYETTDLFEQRPEIVNELKKHLISLK